MPARRMGAEDAANRALLLDTAEKLMIEEGYAAITARHLAEQAGLKYQLVYYYFRNMDDLLMVMYRNVVDRSVLAMEKALAGDNPIRALWELTSDPRQAVLSIEFRALAKHRKAFRKFLAQSLALYRKVQTKHIARFLEARGLGSQTEAIGISVIVTSLSSYLISEKILGVPIGQGTTAFVERSLSQFDIPAPSVALPKSGVARKAKPRPVPRTAKSKKAP